MATVKLTIVSIQNDTGRAGAALFETTKMYYPQAVAAGTQFNHDVQGRTESVVVSETLTQIAALTGQAPYGTIANQLIAVFDAAGGKAVGSYGLLTPSGAAAILPSGAVVTKTYWRVVNSFTSGSSLAQIALGVPTDAVAGIKAALVISNAAFQVGTPNAAGIQDGAVANFMTKITADRQITAAVSVEALTAGKLVLVIDFFVPN